jgi:hypothetical protein
MHVGDFGLAQREWDSVIAASVKLGEEETTEIVHERLQALERIIWQAYGIGLTDASGYKLDDIYEDPTGPVSEVEDSNVNVDHQMEHPSKGTDVLEDETHTSEEQAIALLRKYLYSDEELVSITDKLQSILGPKFNSRWTQAIDVATPEDDSDEGARSRLEVFIAKFLNFPKATHIKATNPRPKRSTTDNISYVSEFANGDDGVLFDDDSGSSDFGEDMRREKELQKKRRDRQKNMEVKKRGDADEFGGLPF